MRADVGGRSQQEFDTSAQGFTVSSVVRSATYKAILRGGLTYGNKTSSTTNVSNTSESMVDYDGDDDIIYERNNYDDYSINSDNDEQDENNDNFKNVTNRKNTFNENYSNSSNNGSPTDKKFSSPGSTSYHKHKTPTQDKLTKNNGTIGSIISPNGVIRQNSPIQQLSNLGSFRWPSFESGSSSHA
jgi:hypothetical protein